MPDFQLATGWVTLKGDPADYDKVIRDKYDQLDKFDKALQDGSLSRAIKQSKRLADAYDRSNKAAQRMVDTIKYGKLGAYFQEASRGLDAFEKRMRPLQMAGAAGFGLASGAVAAAGQAFPLASNTLSDSFSLLTMKIGRTFIPTIAKVSFYLQELGDKWQGLDATTQKLIRTSVEYVGVIGGAVLATSAFTKIMAFAAANPVGMMAGIGLATGVAVNNAWSDAESKRTDDLQKKNAGLKYSDVENDSRMTALRGMSPADAKAAATQDFSDAWNKYERKRQNYEEYRTGFSGGNVAGGITRFADTFTGGSGGEYIQNQAGKAQEELQKAKLRLKAIDSAALPDASASTDTNGRRLRLGSPGGPATSTSSIGDLFKSIQGAALGGSETETEMLRLQLEGNNALREIANNTRRDGPGIVR